MRPLRLDLRGFAVFRDHTTVDFTDTDYFALVGPTGSGKSTVLDAICFALYGTVPRWDDRRSIENALAPSATEARVRLAFQANGARYVATRVVRRDGKGRVSTAHAGLEQLPAGFDLTSFDTSPAQRGATGLGTVLAGTPAEMESAVLAAVGLPYDQFTASVVLPQGEFARFLHAKPRERQDILVNLLGLHAYRRVAERAATAGRDADARAAAARGLLGDLRDADDAALAAAEAEVLAGQQLAERVETELPALVAAVAAEQTARADLADVERELTALTAVRIPTDIATLAAAITAARLNVDTTQAATVTAEEREQKLRAQRDGAGDATTLTRLLDLHATRADLARRSGELGDAVAAATAEHARAATAQLAAQQVADLATAAVTDAHAGVETAQTADRAASLRVHLTAGRPCPVCEHDVTTIPAIPTTPALAAARHHLADAEQAARAATAQLGDHDWALRAADRELAGATARQRESVARLTEITTQLADAPPAPQITAALATIADLDRAVATAATEVRDARHAERAATTALRHAEDRLRAAWTGFDQVRDTLAQLAPPPVDRDDLAASWRDLDEWARHGAAERADTRDDHRARAAQAQHEIEQRTTALDTLFADTPGTTPATGDPAARYRQRAALLVQAAEAAHRRVREQREQAARLADQITAHDQAARVAKTLAQHLRADRFERWLLAEALDALVTGASLILRELTSGQYDLTHDKGEFYVIDHSDAGLRRGVRTLSGGETFQASLALALALCDQLAGLSNGTASLESIMLDEGFGTLDAFTLDTVAATLENLAARGDRMVGVVTHVPALAERIPVRFDVTKDARGASQVIRVT